MASCDGRQRWRRLLLSSAVVVLWRWTAGVEAAPTPQMKAGNQLNDATFDQRISSGLWMVEHYSCAPLSPSARERGRSNALAGRSASTAKPSHQHG